jgi:ABC-type amino acid transport substrate-binding protein
MRARRGSSGCGLQTWLGLTLAVVVAGCTTASAPSPSSIRPPAGAPALRVVIADAVPPYAWAEGDRYVGLEVDFANALASALGRSIRFEAVDFGDVLPTVADGRADIAMAGLTVTRAREVQVAFSDPYVRSGLLALVRREDAARYPTPLSVVDGGQAIGVVGGTTGEAFVKQRVHSSAIMPYPTARAAVDELGTRRIDAVVHDAPVLLWFASRDEANMAPILTLIGDEPLAWAMPRGDDTLQQQVNAVLARWRSDGTRERILARWLPYWQRLESAERSR